MYRTIRKTGIGLVVVVALVLVAHADDKARSVEGAWRHVEQKNGESQEYQKFPDGTEMVDLIVGGRFAWTMVRDGKVVGSAGGRYKAEKDKFTETLEYVNGQGVPESFVGSSFEFTLKFDGDTFNKVGTIKVNGQDYKVDEKWERCKP